MPAKVRLDDKFSAVDDEVVLKPFHRAPKLEKKAHSSSDLLQERSKPKVKPTSTVTSAEDDSFLSKKNKFVKKNYFDDDDDVSSKNMSIHYWNVVRYLYIVFVFAGNVSIPSEV